MIIILILLRNAILSRAQFADSDVLLYVTGGLRMHTGTLSSRQTLVCSESLFTDHMELQGELELPSWNQAFKFAEPQAESDSESESATQNLTR